MRHWLLLLSMFCWLTPAGVAIAATKADYVDPTTRMEFVAIRGGTLMMGSSEEQFEQPAHQVTVKPFLIGRYEVTFDQYAVFCKATGRKLPDDQGWGRGKRPVINVSWEDAVAFTGWLSEKTGRKFRLPSEAEWEYAARGGATGRFPWGDELGKNRTNCEVCGSQWDSKTTAPVGSFAPNGYGLYDVIGNVYEWCLDTKHENYQGAPADGSAWLTGGDETQRIERGGSFRQPAVEMTIARRCWKPQGQSHEELGFRVALEP